MVCAGGPGQFQGPADRLIEGGSTNRLLFVETGTGSPIFDPCFSANSIDPAQLVTLFWGLRYERDLYYQGELKALTDRHPVFSFVTTLSRPGPDWPGVTGRVTTLVQERITLVRDLAVYLCGNGDMLKEVTSILQTKGLCPIYREKYY